MERRHDQASYRRPVNAEAAILEKEKGKRKGAANRHHFELHHQVRMSEADDADQRAGRKIRFEILSPLVVYPMILFHIGRKRCRLDDVRIVSADGAQGAADILATLSQLRSHVAAMDRLGIYFAARGHSGDQYQRASGNGNDLRVRLPNGQILRLDDFFWS
jgi:hypothetical protein